MSATEQILVGLGVLGMIVAAYQLGYSKGYIAALDTMKATFQKVYGRTWPSRQEEGR